MEKKKVQERTTVERQEKDLKRRKGFAKEEKEKEMIPNGLTCT